MPKPALPPALEDFVDLVNKGAYWESHEALEPEWRRTQSPFYHGLILYASAWVHQDRGNPHGIQAQLAKAEPLLKDHAPGYLGIDVSAILDRDAPLKDQVGQIAAAKKKLVMTAGCLTPGLRKIHPTAPYTRNLVHQDPRNRFTVIAIIWGPFQDTAIHDHINWCVVGVLEGSAHVTNYDRLDDGSVPGKAELCIRDSFVTNPGAVAALLPPPKSNIHRMANSGRGPAM